MYLTLTEHAKIIDLVSAGIRKNKIAKLIGCLLSTVYNTLERYSPRNGSEPKLETKKRKAALQIQKGRSPLQQIQTRKNKASNLCPESRKSFT